ncbi:MAG: Homoisocitrate dehydrogenase [Chloroflexota bacterium]|nr:Homoisocitrate dehydrogenase [Chloroflexota bacterium]
MPTICLIPGDGVGREVIPAAARALAAVLPGVQFIEADAGWDCFLRTGTALPDATVAAVAAADGTLFGATQSPNEVVAGYRSPILALRKRFDLYANLRPTTSLLPDGPQLDFLIVRENTEGLYAGRERREDADTAIAERVITRRASERIARVAFEQARRRRISDSRITNHESAIRSFAHSLIRPPSVTIVHKANVLKLTDGLFREACLAVAREYPDVKVNELLVDAAAMVLVKEPGRFDVIVTTNLFGDILSDEAAGLVGGLGVAPSANLGAGRVAVCEPVHGSAPDIAGQGIANPVGAILSAAMLLDHLGQAAAGDRVRRAVAATVVAGITTPDLGGGATTQEVTEDICRRIAADVDQR